MNCFLCGKKIGFLRSLADQQYCSAAHRHESSLASAQALRDEEDHEIWAVAKLNSNKKKPARPSSGSNQTASIFAFLTVAALLVAAVMMPGPAAGPAFHAISLDPGLKRGLLERTGDTVSELIRSKAPATLHHDFNSGWTDWSSVNLKSSVHIDDPRKGSDPKGWLASHTTSLRIWNSSTNLKNYQLDFSGQIEKKSLSWVFRASNEKNYYATKLLITHPGPLPNAGLVRYVMMDGREWDRVQLPLPLTLDRGATYRVRVSVQDDRFITYLNGQVISTWSDKRLHKGGVGFFSDDEDPQKLAWVSLSERDSIMGRVLAHFSFFVIPGAQAPSSIVIH